MCHQDWKVGWTQVTVVYAQTAITSAQFEAISNEIQVLPSENKEVIKVLALTVGPRCERNELSCREMSLESGD